jgi:FAD/FMN-containing dehydrogenase
MLRHFLLLPTTYISFVEKNALKLKKLRQLTHFRPYNAAWPFSRNPPAFRRPGPMILKPKSIEDLCQMLKTANSSRSRIDSSDLAPINALVEYTPEDMTATVQAGMSLDRFQAHLRAHRQWLPTDPPHPHNITIAELLSQNWSGPRRYGYGPIRDYLIGIKVAMADGTVIKAGGKVVKNVAGYDLCKVFIGSKGTLGIIVEATFKLRPLPESELILEKSFDSIEDLGKSAASILASTAEPVILDVHNFTGKPTLVIEIQKASVLPSETINILKKIVPARFVARLGNGVVYHKGTAFKQTTEMPLKLMQRLKQAYDPNAVFPEYRV